jgi:transcriptional regulator with XRE-family HTH domain
MFAEILWLQIDTVSIKVILMVTENAPERLRAWMERSEMSRTELAALLGVSVPTASQLATGARTPSLSLAARIQHVTGIQASEWVRRDDIEGVAV